MGSLVLIQLFFYFSFNLAIAHMYKKNVKHGLTFTIVKTFVLVSLYIYILKASLKA